MMPLIYFFISYLLQATCFVNNTRYTMKEDQISMLVELNLRLNKYDY